MEHVLANCSNGIWKTSPKSIGRSSFSSSFVPTCWGETEGNLTYCGKTNSKPSPKIAKNIHSQMDGINHEHI